MSDVQVVVHADADVLAAAVAARLLTALVDAQASRGSASVVLTGGGVGTAVLRFVHDSPARDAVDWSRVDIWWGDERWVPAGDPQRNDLAAREALLDALPLDPARVHPFPASDGPHPDPESAAAAYAAELATAGPAAAFDVLLLGVGEEALGEGRTLAEMVEALRKAGEYGEGEAARATAEAIIERNRRVTHRSTRERGDGRVFEVVSDPTPGGGFVVTYTDVTEDRRIRAELERRLEAASADCPVLIVRAGDYIGADARSSWFASSMVRAGRPVRRLINPGKGVGHSWAYLPDLAEAFAALLAMPERLRRFERVQFEGIWDADGTLVPDIIRAIVGRDLPEHRFPWWLMRLLAPFGGFPAAVRDVEPYWRHPVRMDNRRLIELLGAEPHTPVETALRDTLHAMGCLDDAAAASRPARA